MSRNAFNIKIASQVYAESLLICVSNPERMEETANVRSSTACPRPHHC